MNRIFCLETEWTHSVHNIKDSSSVKPLLDFFEASTGIKYVFRQVAGRADFEWYLNHLKHPSYSNYDMVYLCFHGAPGTISFPNGESYTQEDFIEYCDGFKGRNLHFGSCSTMKMDPDSISIFKQRTGARLVTGYTKTVDFIDSFVFELWLLNAIRRNPKNAGVRLMRLAEKEQPYFVKNLGFVAY